MKQTFPYQQNDLNAFCPACQAVTVQNVRSQLKMQEHQASLLHSPILFSCKQCEHVQIYFAKELAAFSPQNQGTWHKIAGVHRLVVRDAVYVPGEDYPGQIKSRYRSGNQEVFVIAMPDGTERKWHAPATDTELPLQSVRLLPLSASDALVGDPVWHAVREQIGTVVGIVFGNPSKLVIQLQNGVLLTLALPDSRNIAEPTQLHKSALALLKAFFSSDEGELNVESSNGILHIRGVCDSLQKWIDLRRRLKNLPNCRGIVELVAIQPSEIIADDILENACKNLMLAPHYGVFNLKVHCSKGHCRVDAFCRNESQRIEAIEAIESIPGICSLEAEIVVRIDDNHEDRERSLQVAQALRNNTTLKHCVIRVHCYEGLTQLEGIVSTTMQRNIAGMAAMWAGRRFKIDNQLRVEPNYPYSSPNIRII